MPTARLVCFFKAATTPAESSGKDVPNATRVKPIVDSDIPKEYANFSDPIIKYFDPK